MTEVTVTLMVESDNKVVALDRVRNLLSSAGSSVVSYELRSEQEQEDPDLSVEPSVMRYPQDAVGLR